MLSNFVDVKNLGANHATALKKRLEGVAGVLAVDKGF